MSQLIESRCLPQTVDLPSSAPCRLHAELDGLVIQRTEPSQLDFVSTISETHATALRVARLGHLDHANTLLAVGHDLLAAISVDAQVRLALTSMRGGVEAYVRYKDGRRTVAESILIRTMQIDAELITCSGLTSILAHVVQLGHNLVRVARGIGPHEVRHRADLVLGYVDGQSWPWPTRPEIPAASCLSHDCRAALRCQILGELALGRP